jgi:hypothetical protein
MADASNEEQSVSSVADERREAPRAWSAANFGLSATIILSASVPLKEYACCCSAKKLTTVALSDIYKL